MKQNETKYRKNLKHSLKLTLDLIRPKQKFLGVMLALVNGLFRPNMPKISFIVSSSLIKFLFSFCLAN